MGCLKREHASMHFKIAKEITGIPPPRHTHVYRDLNVRVESIMLTETLLTFIFNLTYFINFS